MNTHLNVDPAEIQKFDALADEWWDPKGPMQALHQLNPLRLSFIKTHATVFGKRVLDVGCGAGILSEALAKEGAIVSAIDLSPAALRVAKEHAISQNLNIDYQEIALETLMPSHSFDVISCMELLEHVPNPAELIQQCARLVRPGGFVFFSTLNRNLKAYALAILAAEYLLNILPKGTHRYDQFIKPSELNQWATNTHLNLVDLQGIRYHPLSQSFKFSSSVDVNYLMCFQRASHE